MLTLWYSPGTVALAPHIALEETGAPYELRPLSFADGEQRGASFLAVNPKGRVPALETSEGILTETLAILAWLAEAYPEAGLRPTTPFARARALSLETYLASTMHVAHAHKLRGARWSDDPAAWTSMTAKVAQNMTDCATLLDDAVAGPWALGQDYCTTDPYLYTICRWLGADGVDRQAFPALEAHARAMEARPAVQRALAHH